MEGMHLDGNKLIKGMLLPFMLAVLVQMVLVDLTAVEMVETIFLVQVGALVTFVLEELRKHIVF